jgi:hypothetical protein
MAPCELGGFLPPPVVSHRAFDGEHASVVVGDDQVKRPVGFVSGHGLTLLLIKSVINSKKMAHLA